MVIEIPLLQYCTFLYKACNRYVKRQYLLTFTAQCAQGYRARIRVTPTEVNIVVNAPVMEATRLTDDDIQTFVDLNEVDITHKKARIRVYVPRGVVLKSITPDEATVEFIE